MSEDKNKDQKINNIICVIVTCLAALFIIFCINGCLDEFKKAAIRGENTEIKTEEEHEDFTLEALSGKNETKTTGSIHGSFLLIGGSIDGEVTTEKKMTIRYMVRTKYGCQYQSTIWDSSVYIDEYISDNEKPIMRKVYTKEVKYVYGKKEDEWYRRLVRTIFIVPKGSIVKDYKLNIFKN